MLEKVYKNGLHIKPTHKYRGYITTGTTKLKKNLNKKYAIYEK
jgi:hypothetical protein